MPGSLEHLAADIMRRILIDRGHGHLPTATATTNWPIYVSQEPSSPDNVVTIYDTSGPHQGRTMIDGEVQERHGIQVRVRSANHATGSAKIQSLMIAMDQNVYSRTAQIDTSVYKVHAVSRGSGPFSLGKEEGSKRDIFTLNATISVRQTE